MSSPALGEVITPALAMDLAIREGAKGAGFVSPNPLVGCTIVDRDHRLLAVGYHQRVGFDHAEIDAMKKAGGATFEGAHFYVTLEPCAHQGRTPSCARTIAPLRAGSVTYAVEDPNPLVAGQGAAILREAGIHVSLLSEREDIPATERVSLGHRAEALAEIFLHNFRVKEPFVAVKVASSLDGQLALTTGESKWITSEPARLHTHAVRARYDAVAIGVNTLVNDDPSLNVRHPAFPDFQNRAVVFDPLGKSLAALKSSRLLAVRPPESVIIVVGERAAGEAVPDGVKLLVVRESAPAVFEMGGLLAGLKSCGLTSVMIEGGAQTISSFIDAKKAQRLHLYLAPTLLGGRNGIGWTSGFGIEAMSSKILLHESEREILGQDLYWTALF